MSAIRCLERKINEFGQGMVKSRALDGSVSSSLNRKGN
jgi:hypothetical protein